MNETSKTGRIVYWNRVVLGLFWVAVGLASIGLILWRDVRLTKLAPVPVVAGIILITAAWGFYTGKKWGRILIGVVMAFVALYCFDRLLYLGFRKMFNWFFYLLCAMLAVAFYTWLYLFSGLDRGGPVQTETTDDEVRL
ncbi:MAG: hypothetical protein GX456_18990 [Verrucomicrobia bacterium]|nr:hypothetical protein [Verrucomicrobiota bacterium]